MIPIPVPDMAKDLRPLCELVRMGPPPGVSEDECGTVEMLISNERIPGMGRAQYAYYRPSETELQVLKDGGWIEVAQWGHGVQPFSAVVWGPVDVLVQQARDLVQAERERQKSVEGYSEEHDREHAPHEFLLAARAYEASAAGSAVGRDAWPWSAESFKPRDRRSDLIRAAALLQAELDLQRNPNPGKFERERDRLILLIAQGLHRQVALDAIAAEQ